MSIPADFAYYEIYRSSNGSSGPFIFIGTSTTTDYDDSEVVLGSTYCYYIVSVDLYGNRSSPSSKTCVFFSTQGVVNPEDPESPTTPQIIFNPSVTLSKDNVICVYRQGDEESLLFALRYQQIHNLSDDQVVGIPCSNVEILQDFITFQAEIEVPLRNKITSFPFNNRSVYAVVLMPYVPGGFRDGSDIISSTSRISRIFYPFIKNEYNNVYNRQIFNRFNGYDALKNLICTRIDGPSTVTENWFSNIELSKERLQVNGTFYVDPYSSYNFSGASSYTLEVVDFLNKYIERLGLGVESTSQINSSIDPFFSKLEDDSFFWGWGSSRGSLSYFQETSNIRFFFYNADFDGGITLRDLDSTTWPLLAIRKGYISSAGLMSGSDASLFLRPIPFMDALFRGSTLGEAFIFSQPRLNSSMACFGDALSVVSFPLESSSSSLLTAIDSWKKMESCMSESISYLYRKCNIIKNLRDKVASGDSVNIQENFIYLLDDLYTNFDLDSWKIDYVNLVSSMVDFVVDRNSTSFSYAYPNLNQYLLSTGSKISKISLEVLQNQALINSLSSSVMHEEGSWEFEDVIEFYDGDFRFYHFELQVAASLEDFEDNILINKLTLNNISNWYFENYNGEFEPMSINGITSNYEGRKVRYSSNDNEGLIRGEFYWFRIRQKDELQEFPWRYYRKIIFR